MTTCQLRGTLRTNLDAREIELAIRRALPAAEIESLRVIERGERDAYFLEAAREEHGEEGLCEIDSDAVVSDSDDGAYVEAWVWVYNDQVGEVCSNADCMAFADADDAFCAACGTEHE